MDAASEYLSKLMSDGDPPVAGPGALVLPFGAALEVVLPLLAALADADDGNEAGMVVFRAGTDGAAKADAGGWWTRVAVMISSLPFNAACDTDRGFAPSG